MTRKLEIGFEVSNKKSFALQMIFDGADCIFTTVKLNDVSV